MVKYTQHEICYCNHFKFVVQFIQIVSQCPSCKMSSCKTETLCPLNNNSLLPLPSLHPHPPFNFLYENVYSGHLKRMKSYNIQHSVTYFTWYKVLEVHHVKFDRVPFLFKTEYYPILWICHISFIYQWTYGVFPHCAYSE